MKQKIKKETIIRYGVLIFFLILFSIFSLRHFILGGGVAPSIDALCPFGGFETLFTFIVTGSYVPRILISGLILAVGILITVLIFKRSFCGYICPFGTVQELLGKITKNKIIVPKNIDKYARNIKYLVFLAILIGTAITGTLVFRNYDPFVTFFHFGKGILWDYSPDEFLVGIIPFIITIIILLLSVFIERAWCKYLCPLGAIMSIFAKFGATKIVRDKKTCINCKICDKKCPMNVDISTQDKVKDVECINCNVCVTSCPKSSLSIQTFNKKYSVILYIILSVVVFFSIIGISKAIGIWQSVPSTTLTDNNTGQINTEYIKGWMTLSEVSKESNIDLKYFIRDLNLPIDINPNTPLKDIASTYNIDFETEVLREYIQNYKPDLIETETTIETKSVKCPWNIHNDYYPGRCGLYQDKNLDGICDLSQ